MSDLIRREDAIDVAFQLRRKDNDEDWKWWLSVFNGIPGADAVEVVRCKDCEFYVTDGGALMICDITNCIVIDDDYCSYGRSKQ